MEQPNNTTPGPWQAYGVTIARVGTWDAVGRVETAGGNCAERDANAALMAAAPELYSALHAIVDRIEGDVQAYDPDEGETAPDLRYSPEYRDAMNALRRAGWTK